MPRAPKSYRGAYALAIGTGLSFAALLAVYQGFDAAMIGLAMTLGATIGVAIRVTDWDTPRRWKRLSRAERRSHRELSRQPPNRTSTGGASRTYESPGHDS